MSFQLDDRLAADCETICDLALCQVLLMKDSQYPWLILVPKVDNAREIIDLSAAQQQLFWQESAFVSEVLQSMFSPDKLNVAALGNMVPQLHVHHIARFTHDPAWPKPVWGQRDPIPYEAEKLGSLKQAFFEQLTK